MKIKEIISVWNNTNEEAEDDELLRYVIHFGFIKWMYDILSSVGKCDEWDEWYDSPVEESGYIVVRTSICSIDGTDDQIVEKFIKDAFNQSSPLGLYTDYFLTALPTYLEIKEGHPDYLPEKMSIVTNDNNLYCDVYMVHKRDIEIRNLKKEVEDLKKIVGAQLVL